MYINMVASKELEYRVGSNCTFLTLGMLNIIYCIGFAVTSCAGFSSATRSDLWITSKRNQRL